MPSMLLKEYLVKIRKARNLSYFPVDFLSWGVLRSYLEASPGFCLHSKHECFILQRYIRLPKYNLVLNLVFNKNIEVER